MNHVSVQNGRPRCHTKLPTGQDMIPCLINCAGTGDEPHTTQPINSCVSHVISNHRTSQFSPFIHVLLKHKPRSKNKLYTTQYNLLQEFTHHPVLLLLSLVTVLYFSVAVVSLSWLAPSQEGWLLLVSHSQTPGVSCKDQECVHNRE